MSDENLPEAHAAFERLDHQAAGLDTMAARRAIEQRSRHRRQSLGALVADQHASTQQHHERSSAKQHDERPFEHRAHRDPLDRRIPGAAGGRGRRRRGVGPPRQPGRFMGSLRVGPVRQAVGHFCDSPWVMVTNYDRVVGAEVGPTLPPDEAALALAEADPDFTIDDGIVWTPEPISLTLIAVEAETFGRVRAADPSWPTDAGLTPEDLDLVAAFDAIDGSDPIDVGPLRLAESGVRLGLSNELLVTRTTDELSEPAAWSLEREMFRAYVGPFSALELLAGPLDTTVLAGSHGQCASPPQPVHPELQGLRRLSIQRVDIDSCLQWYTVDLYLDDAGDVVGITLDLYEP